MKSSQLYLKLYPEATSSQHSIATILTQANMWSYLADSNNSFTGFH